MPCPDSDNCSKKACIEQSVCMGDYWPNYWKNKLVDPLVGRKMPPGWKSKTQVRKEKRQASKEFHFKEPCAKTDTHPCDKKDACDVLGQCIITLQMVQDNPPILQSLRGPHTARQIVEIFRQHNITPMKSYYFNTKYLKK